jgi:dolichyl-phosphate-mannose-protein mannosyltransferase
MKSERSGLDRFATGVLLLGVFLRLRQYIEARPLWLDEAMLSLNVLTRSFRGLLQPLDQDQTAPAPFLWGEKALTLILGPSELVLRVIPLMAGIAFLLVLRRLTARLLSPSASLLALLLGVLSPLLIQYSTEAKPYSLDALLAAVVLLLALEVLEAPQSVRNWRRLAIAGTVTALSSVPAVFTWSGVVPALASKEEIRTDRAAWRRLALTAALWLVLFGLSYELIYRPAAQSPYMQRYWTPYFLTLASGGKQAGFLIGTAITEFLLALGGLWRVSAALLFLVPLALGLGRLWKDQGPSKTLLIGLPLVAVIGASALRLYPFASRLLLFGAASTLIVIAAGLDDLADRVGRLVKGPWLVLGGAAILSFAVLDATRSLLDPPRRDDLGPLIVELEENHQPGAAVYVFARSVPAWLYYTTDWKELPDTARVRHLGGLVSSGGRAFRHAPSRGGVVKAEGDDLLFHYRDWVELIGVPTGMGPDEYGINREQPDSGWAENEVRRLKATGSSDCWIVMSAFTPVVPATLRKEIEQEGGKILLWKERQVAVLGRVRFGSAGAVASPLDPVHQSQVLVELQLLARAVGHEDRGALEDRLPLHEAVGAQRISRINQIHDPVRQSQ